MHTEAYTCQNNNCQNTCQNTCHTCQNTCHILVIVRGSRTKWRSLGLEDGAAVPFD